MSGPNGSSRVTWEGCSVLLDINDGERLVFARLSPNATLKIGKNNCSLQPLVGCPFGALFNVENGKDGPYLSRAVLKEEGEEDNNFQGTEENVLGDQMKDNREIVDNNTAQTLTGEEIEEMKRQGTSGDQIIEALIANSSTFQKKTVFSQEKYRLRKQKKYAPTVLVRRPFARSICDAYFRKFPAKIGCLRSDSLSLLLSMANISAHSDILVVDLLGGIVTGSVAERLGGTGHVCNMYLSAKPYPIEIVRIFNFNNDINQRIVCCGLHDLCPGQMGTSEKIEAVISESADGLEERAPADEKVTSEDITCESASRDTAACKSCKAGEKASPDLINSWKEQGFSSLVVAAADVDVWSIVQKLHPLLSHSASFAIYHQYLQPLAECMHKLQVGKMAIGLQISEPWMREYQVLPSRTHPHMQMSAFGGYVLSGTKICVSNMDVE